MAFILASSGITSEMNVVLYGDYEGRPTVSIRIGDTSSSSLCMTLAEAEALRDKLSAIIEPADTTKISEVA